MKLTNSFIDLEKLRKKLRAPETNYNFGTQLDKLAEIRIKLETGGIEVDSSEVEKVGPFFSYADQLVIHYIRDTKYSRKELLKTTVDKKAPKFHFYSKCSTLEVMTTKGKKDRYIVTRHQTNKFLVKDSDNKEIPDTILYVCKNCLIGSNYRNYRGSRHHSSDQERIQAVKDFDISTFLAENQSPYEAIHHTNKNSGKQEYTDDWPEVTRKKRQDANWVCSECHVDMSKKKEGLHTHHKDRNKVNNQDDNLQVLCALCHHNHHNHHPIMDVPENIKKYILRRRP